MDSWNSQKMLDKCIYDYFVKKGMHETAEAFANEAEANAENITHEAIGSPEEFLEDWWAGFYGVYNSNQAEHAQEPYAEAPRNMENVIPQVPYVMPASSPPRLAHNISLVVPAFGPERSQEDEVTSELRFLEMDHPSRMAVFVTDSSYPMEQIPNMPQQWEARDEGEGRGIYFEQTTWMEPNANDPEVSMLPVPDPSEEGSSTGSCSEMQQGP